MTANVGGRAVGVGAVKGGKTSGEFRRLEAVLFDFDGTIVDTRDLILSSFHHAVCNVLGVDYADEVFLRTVGKPLAVQMKDFSAGPDIQEELCRSYREHNARVHEELIRIFPNVQETIATLRAAGIKTGIVTSKRHESALRGMRAFDLEPLFDVVVASDDCPKHKPDPEPVCQAAHMLGLAPESCAYVGDSPYDMQAGRGAGCLTVAVLWGMFSEDVLRAEGPDVVLRSFEELRAFAR